jgi:hypothetical protein
MAGDWGGVEHNDGKNGKVKSACAYGLLLGI